MPNKCLLNVEFRTFIDLIIGSDFNIVLKNGNEAHFIINYTNAEA